MQKGATHFSKQGIKEQIAPKKCVALVIMRIAGVNKFRSYTVNVRSPKIGARATLAPLFSVSFRELCKSEINKFMN
jgi:hypothetical protein